MTYERLSLLIELALALVAIAILVYLLYKWSMPREVRLAEHNMEVLNRYRDEVGTSYVRIARLTGALAAGLVTHERVRQELAQVRRELTLTKFESESERTLCLTTVQDALIKSLTSNQRIPDEDRRRLLADVRRLTDL